jgi:phosphatidate cytidylyltransferase
MLAKRVLVTVILLPIGLALIIWGGPAYYAFIGLVLVLAAREYVNLYRAGGLRPAGVLILAGVLLLVAGRAFFGFAGADWMISLVVLAALTFHLIDFERGRLEAGTDFGLTLAGVLYLGWIGAYLISLRTLPDGIWWVLLSLPSVWIADSGAYAVGSRWGRRKMTPRLSPKKTWEGYWGGVVSGTLGAALLAYVFQTWLGAGPAITPFRGALLGLLLSLLTTLGDLGESMIKRQVGVKDSGTLLPGHGGVFDRIDSWLWAGVLAYYLVIWFF